MRIVWRIFVRDISHATRNVIAIIVAMGLVIVPALYAWFNIAASWDPYSNTRALKVAVANEDEGYKSDLIPVKINVGETVISALRANHDLDWQFVDRDQAVEGVTSGDYYAAIVIPKPFSADMMTLFSSDVQHASLEYYLNEKINPIAPKIMDEGAGTVATTIDKTFVTTIGEVGLDLAQEVLTYAQSPDMQQYAGKVSTNLVSVRDQLNAAAAQIDSYSALLGSIGGIIDSTDALLGQTSAAVSGAQNALTQALNDAKGLGDAFSAASGSIGDALSRAAGAYDQVSAKTDDAFGAMGTQADQVNQALTDMQGKVSADADAFSALADQLSQMASSVQSQVAKDALNAQAQRARDAANALRGLAGRFGAASDGVTGGVNGVAAQRDALKRSIADAKSSVQSVSDDYRQNLKPQLDALAASLTDVSTQTGAALSSVNAMTSDGAALGGEAAGGLGSLRGVMDSASGSLKDAANRIDSLETRIAGVLSGGLTNLPQTGATQSGADAEAIATLLSAPVALDRIPVYPIANYGSAMAPFYTILSIWVGAIILVAMLKVAVSDREKAHVLGLKQLPDSLFAPRRAGAGADSDAASGRRRRGSRARRAKPRANPLLSNPGREAPGNAASLGIKPYHEYLGRAMIFVMLALLQGSLVCLGDLFYLGVQADHILQFLLVGWLAALVFSVIVYTLAVSFGDIGKAIAVVLLVVQVAGSGGTFPIQMLPPFFQALYPWLPFPHAIDAMHAAMAGSYGSEYWTSMLALAAFLLPALLLGLVLRAPVMRLNTWVIRNLESTKVM